MALTQVSTGGIKDGQVQTTDLADGQVTVGKLHADALDRTYTLGADGNNHYTFTGEGLTGAVNDPTLYLTRGKTYRFVNGNSSGAHPFRIQTTVNGSAGTEYNTGVTNNGGAGGSTIVFEVPHAAPDVLYYQCTSHNAMGGILYVTGALADGSVTENKIHAGAVTQGKLANNSVTTNKIAVDAINNSHISNNSVDTAEIYDEAITLAKLEHGTSSNDGKFLRANNGADPTFETVTGTTINNNADNRVITGSGTANTLNGESNVTVDSNGRLTIGLTAGGVCLTASSAGSTYGGALKLRNTISSNHDWIMAVGGGDNAYVAGRGLLFRDETTGINHTQFQTNGNIRIVDGNLQVASGHGIDFSPTANTTTTGASMSNELLSDYEEGSWTPVLNSGTVTTAYANYVRIGRMCWLTADFYNMSDTSSGTGIMITAASLPFSKSSFSDGIYMGTAPNRYFSHSSKDTLFHWFMNGSGIHMQSSNDAIGDKAYSNVTHSHIDASYSAFKLAGWYVV